MGLLVAGGWNTAAADLVWGIHALLVVLAVWAPWSGSDALVALDFAGIPLLWVHWLTADDTCALTLLEGRLRGCAASDTFVHKIVSPLYRISDAGSRRLAWGASVALWLACAARVAADPGLLSRAFFTSPTPVTM